MLGLSALFLKTMFRFGRGLHLREIFTSMITVLWSAMPSTAFSFFINPGLFVKTRSTILLAFPCLRVGSLTCWISPCSSTSESSLLAATVLYPLLGVTLCFSQFMLRRLKSPVIMTLCVFILFPSLDRDRYSSSI